jgi:hypothetical protein
MKGKDTFTPSEVEAIKLLIRRKLVATTNEQKGIRNKIRDIGFFWSDYSSDKGYTVADFEGLIRSGQVRVVGAGIPATMPTEQGLPVHEATRPLEPMPTKTVAVGAIIENLKRNRFDPQCDRKEAIPNQPGNYLLCLKRDSHLPKVDVEPVFTTFEGLDVIYTGIASKNLRKRDYEQHFVGNNAGRSTLRKSLGALFGYTQVARDKDPNTGKTKFGEADEERLSEWMCNNIVMYFWANPDSGTVEHLLIEHFHPPLNLEGNRNPGGADFRALLSRLRQRKGLVVL